MAEEGRAKYTESRPPRDAWIETLAQGDDRVTTPCRVPHGTRGLKLLQSLGKGPVAPVASPTGRVD